MRRAGHLFEQVVAWENLLCAAHHAARGKRRRPQVAAFLFRLEPELLKLCEELTSGVWQPGTFHTFRIADPKPRTISAAPFPDRVVHHALMNVLDPIFDRCLIHHTYACRRGRGTHAAVAQAKRLVLRHPWALKADVESFFASVDHALLKGMLRRLFKDRRLLEVLERIVDSGGENGRGLPIGNLTSQYFANHVLGRLDRFVTQELRVGAYLRYMDDVLVFGGSAEELHLIKAAVSRFLEGELGLRLKERATIVAPTHRGVSFLGFRIYPALVRVAPERLRRSRRRVVRRQRELAWGRIGEDEAARSVGASLAHLSHASSLGLRRRWFSD